MRGMSDASALLADVAALLRSPDTPWPALLERVLRHFACPLGTIHVLAADGLMHLTTHRGLPPPVLDKVSVIPIGKGMAGLAAQRKQPVQVCNLQTDTSGVARPDARLTKMEGSLAAPMLDGETLRGVFGIAKPVPYDFTVEETRQLMDVGAVIARWLSAQTG